MTTNLCEANLINFKESAVLINYAQSFNYLSQEPWAVMWIGLKLQRYFSCFKNSQLL